MNSFVLKVIALISMISDHTGKVFFPNLLIPLLIGKIALPLFSYQIIYSFNKTKNKNNFLKKIFIFAIISQIPYHLMAAIITPLFSLNILFTYFLLLTAITLYERKKIIGIIFLTLIIILNQIIHLDGGLFGITIIISFYYFTNICKHKNKKLLMIMVFILLCINKYLPYIITQNIYQLKINTLFIISTAISAIIIFLHNGEQGLKTKHFFYILYPLHMLIIYVIYTITIK